MFKTNEVLLNSLLDDVESAKIQLPDFQRGWDYGMTYASAGSSLASQRVFPWER